MKRQPVKSVDALTAVTKVPMRETQQMVGAGRPESVSIIGAVGAAASAPVGGNMLAVI